MWSQFESQFCPNFSQSRPFLKIGTPLDQSDCVSVPIFRNWEIGTDTHSDWLVSKSQQTWPTKRSSIFAVTAKLLTSINIALRMVFTERFKIKYQWYYFKDMLKWMLWKFGAIWRSFQEDMAILVPPYQKQSLTLQRLWFFMSLRGLVLANHYLFYSHSKVIQLLTKFGEDWSCFCKVIGKKVLGWDLVIFTV